MKKLFVCLANSKKYTQRCIAGIELQSLGQTSGYGVVRKNENPVWLRPVSNHENGAVPSVLVDHVNLLDIVELDVTHLAPRDFQSENVLFASGSLQVVGHVPNSTQVMDQLISLMPGPLFGNKERSVHRNQIGRVKNSLILIKPLHVRWLNTENAQGMPQVRAKFIFRNVEYNLPVTDIDFSRQFNLKPNIGLAYPNIYLTISLGLVHLGKHFKLVAGVVP